MALVELQLDAHDIAAALALEAPSSARGVDLRWLARSQRAPRRFFAALEGLLGQVATLGAKSSLERGVDLYHDMVLRHLGANRIAARFHDPRRPAGQRWITLGFDDLHAQVSARAHSWAAQGVEPGSLVCVALPLGPECVVALLSALRLGARVSLLEPEGPDFMALRLATLAPQYIASEAFYRDRLGDLDALGAVWLGEATTSPPNIVGSIGSHCYLPGEACALLFSPLREPPHVPVPLLAEAALFGALRDGAITLALRPGDTIAAPGFSTLQHQPALLFAVLLMGATFVHVDAEQVRLDPTLLTRLPLRSVGVSAATCDALLEGAFGARPAWAHVFKNPEEPTDWESWRELVEGLGLSDTPMSNVLIEAASGGSLLASPRRPGKAFLAQLMTLSPAAGRAWTLLDFSGSDQATLTDVGVFAPLEGAQQAGAEERGDEGAPVEPRYVILGRRRGLEYLYGGTSTPRRSGRVYPAQEVLDALADCPFLQAASLVTLSAGGPTLAHRFVLLGFTGFEPEPRFRAAKQRRVDELSRVIATRLSADHLPDRVELFMGHARMREGQVDHAWCRDQYLGGVAFRKQTSPLFQSLGALRALAAPNPP